MTRLLDLLRQLTTRPLKTGLLLEELDTTLDLFSPPRQYPVHGTLPYRHPDFSPQQPVLSPQIVPAYRLATPPAATAADLAGSDAAPVSALIARQAQEIARLTGRTHWDPAAIYNWVRENIRTEWYWGSMKGAEETLRQRCGNDADQAALLIALLRASGYPARYVRGVIEFFPSLDAAREMTGIADPGQLLAFFRAAGIPCEPVYAGDRIINIRLEHLWVEALVPYANYRGLIADTTGRLWVPLDTSMKTGDNEEIPAIDLLTIAGNPLTGFRDRYLDASREETPLKMLEQETNQFLATVHPGAVFADTLHIMQQRSLSIGILPGALQFVEVAVTAEYPALPADLVHQVHLSAADDEAPLFDLVMPVRRLSNRKITVSFEPAAVADQELVNLWGGLDNTPPYLVRLRPVLVIDGERIAVGVKGLSPGDRFHPDGGIFRTVRQCRRQRYG